MQLRCATLYAKANPAPVSDAPGRSACARPPDDRLRIGYLSADLTEHALSFLMAGVFEQHDRSRFETTAFALRKDETSALGRRVRSAFERVVDVEGMTDSAIASAVRQHQIDILIDLTGYTSGPSGEVLAARAAPVQASYLGFPGTLGPSKADYLIADEFVVPQASREFYSEAIAYLPECFQANEHRRTPAAAAVSRAAVVAS